MIAAKDKIDVAASSAKQTLVIRMSGLFLAMVGGVVAIAFFAPLRRRAAVMFEQSPESVGMLVAGGCIGLALLVIGVVMASWYRQTVPTYRAHRPRDQSPRDDV